MDATADAADPDGDAPGSAAGAPPSPALMRWAVALLVLLGAFGLLGLAVGPMLRLTASVLALDLRTADAPALAPLAQPSVIEAADGSVLGRVGSVEREVVALDEIPHHTREAAVAGEDRRFREHDGYDVAGIGRALLANLRAREVVQGGSTITQQVARANFLDDAQTVRRKAQEISYAAALEERLTKDEILERYLNEVYFGSGAHGIQAAAQEYFRVDAADLTAEQSALLIGVIPAPSSFNPRASPAAAKARRDGVLAAMAEEGYLSEGRARALSEQPLDVAEPREPPEDAEPFIVDAVKRQFAAESAFGDTAEERSRLLETGGLTVRTTIDPDLQEAARDAIDDEFDDEGDPTSALVAVDPEGGAVLAMRAGTDYEQAQFDVITRGRRQPGSAFKPFVLAAALEEGVEMDETLEGDSPATFEDVDDWDEDSEGVRNFDDIDHGSPTLREALVDSVNTAFAELVIDVGPAAVADLAGRLGIDVGEAIGPDPGPAIALGGLGGGVTPLEMASAYAALANDGAYAAPTLIASVEDADGTTLHEPDAVRVQAVEQAVARTTTAAMQEVVSEGTGTAAQLSGWEPAGKTGTTQDSADAWFVGSVPGLTAAVWVGHPEGRVPMPGMTGGAVAAPLWADFMRDALDDEDPVDFPEPDDQGEDGDDEGGDDLADG